MPSFKTTRVVAHSADEMFALVADVQDYPQFLPMCEALNVRSRKERDGKTLLLANMTVGYKAIHETFTSQVLLKSQERKIDVSYVDGPFRYLDNRWVFEDRGEGHSAVHFAIDYEFKSRILGALMGSMFDRAFRAFAEAFERRADEIYSSSSTEKAPERPV
ncbi:type II toxin-antitoxin system RatA family toxin [Notoacmeibacter sp. MSK16QG-6]|uniref:type II toxin-antitoxin system RatA family toxin n=1 Tax=Notoacmeibacter sp. MSK16QG-6 TaxID=2957982 RepID=UPI0020A00376|nr:type II toxin-antitoxin system RatA family toxin [Notoacmeibacter sp. MSK16QG-6]MCP1200763.1 type II toxin-antitoxin system RatA family toxin [Notoacmeibacter sp. MSK16QG-6]